MLAQALAAETLRDAQLLCSAEAVQQGLQRIASEITRELEHENPLVLCVMKGAVVFAGQLLPLLKFPLDLDYLHVTRYGDAIHGGELQWRVSPETAVSGRTILVLDDILDEGHTLLEIRKRMLAAGAKKVYSAVFVDKDLGKPKCITADFIGVRLPNFYLFGFGMDVQGAWRNLPAIYALKPTTS